MLIMDTNDHKCLKHLSEIDLFSYFYSVENCNYTVPVKHVRLQ